MEGKMKHPTARVRFHQKGLVQELSLLLQEQ